MENFSLAGELASVEEQLRNLLHKTISEIVEYSQSQFGDSHTSSAIYNIAMNAKKEMETTLVKVEVLYER
jgi:hypothetical protein